MTDDPFNKIKGLEGFDTSKLLSTINTTPSYQKSHNEFLENYNKSIDSFIEHRKKEAEEDLRRHDEQVEASKNSRASVIIGSIGDNATGFSMSSKDFPVTIINQVFNYEKASKVLDAINKKFNDSSFNSEFGDDAELVKQLINKALKQIKNKDDPTLIQNSLAVVSDIATRVSSGVIASGIILLLGRLSKIQRN
ncbi:hypothetical protein E4K67_15615 [Desulfosporosinus fructosivorans]|uniref:Uncharacterized protein n=1 Tax=Desulfosporosinus fructosivorans TaxID=2018669 RepID=A0A4Z0R3A9_9FIRM|nr:hypothetical protein [Desulfosporosinus fructosivorans]TGE37278.1 hypothetical protein E4K67_15615 [Desulfosporosinus fructosivorans]